MIQDCQMVVKKFNINFKFNDKFAIDSQNMMRGVLIANKELKNEYINFFFDAYWSFNIDLTDEKNVINILEKNQINVDNFFNDIKKKETIDILKKSYKRSF